MKYCILHYIIFTQAPREGASFITSQSELGGYREVARGGGGGGQDWRVFSVIPQLELDKPRCQRGLCWARFRSFWVSGFLDVQRETGLL